MITHKQLFIWCTVIVISNLITVGQCQRPLNTNVTQLHNHQLHEQQARSESKIHTQQLQKQQDSRQPLQQLRNTLTRQSLLQKSKENGYLKSNLTSLPASGVSSIQSSLQPSSASSSSSSFSLLPLSSSSASSSSTGLSALSSLQLLKFNNTDADSTGSISAGIDSEQFPSNYQANRGRKHAIKDLKKDLMSEHYKWQRQSDDPQRKNNDSIQLLRSKLKTSNVSKIEKILLCYIDFGLRFCIFFLLLRHCD